MPDSTPRVSITEIELWQKCAQAHKYRYVDRVSIQREESAPLTIGKQFSDIMERVLSVPLRLRDITAILDEYKEDNRVLVGTERALANVPQEIWEWESPVTEDKLEVPYWYDIEAGTWHSCLTEPASYQEPTEPDLIVVGKPDKWSIDKNEDGTINGVLVDEFKTTAKASDLHRRLYSYQTYSPQPTRYAVMLADFYPWIGNTPLYRRHLIFSQATTGTNGYFEGYRMPVPTHMLQTYRNEMCGIAAMINRIQAYRNWSPMCDYCDYRNLCLSWVAGHGPEHEDAASLFDADLN